MAAVKWIILSLIVIFALAVSPWVIATAYMQVAGQVVQGSVVAKREAIVLPGGDSWDHLFEITYKYQPSDSSYPEIAKHRVDSALYRHIQIGSTVPVRYSPLRMLRPVVGLGSFLDESSLLSRLGLELFTVQHLITVAIIGIGLLVALVALRRKSVRLGIIAAWFAVSPAPGLFLAITAFVMFPVLFWSWRQDKGGAYAWLLLVSIPLSAVVVYWQIPQPTRIPVDSQRYATAIVRQVRIVDEIWTRYGSRDSDDPGGQGIRRPFQMADLEFKRDGANDPIHVLDRVDLNSVPGLREGAKVQIAYSFRDPRMACLVGGTHDYVRATLIYLLGLTYGIGGILAFLVLPALVLADRLFRAFTKILPVRSPDEGLRLLSRLPTGDPRREAVEKAIRALQKYRQRRTAEH